ncbi:hypothetical protein GGI07_005497 [Coemansia sp. Benny D115]|nr:hypothetical protein GGI07_005497 [Coemansia sp. Benny D115]
MQAYTLLSAAAAALCCVSAGTSTVGKRQFYEGQFDGGYGGIVPPPPPMEAMGMGANKGYGGPFASFWNQGMIPGQGFPQIGMSSYGYGLPGYGMSQYMSPDAQILAGVGEGSISKDDIKALEDKMNGYSQFKDSTQLQRNHPDPAFPGQFSSEMHGAGKNADSQSTSCDKHCEQSNSAPMRSGSALALAVAAAAVLAALVSPLRMTFMCAKVLANALGT